MAATAGPAVDIGPPGLSQVKADGNLIVLLGEGVGGFMGSRSRQNRTRSPAGSRTGQQISPAETTATIGTCREVCQHIANCQLLIANCLVEGNWRYVDIVCSIRMNAIRCKCDARLGFLQSTLHQYRCLFCFWPLAKRRFHSPFFWRQRRLHRSG